MKSIYKVDQQVWVGNAENTLGYPAKIVKIGRKIVTIECEGGGRRNPHRYFRLDEGLDYPKVSDGVAPTSRHSPRCFWAQEDHINFLDANRLWQKLLLGLDGTFHRPQHVMKHHIVEAAGLLEIKL